MNLAYLVDTDWAIHWLHDNEQIRNRLEELREKMGSQSLQSRLLNCGKACTTHATNEKANINYAIS